MNLSHDLAATPLTAVQLWELNVYSIKFKLFNLDIFIIIQFPLFCYGMTYLLIFFFLCFSDMIRHPSTDFTPSDSGSSPSDSGSSPSPSTPQKVLPGCIFGPRLLHATPSSTGSTRPQPEGSDHRNPISRRLSGKLGGHGPCGRHIPFKMERIKVCFCSFFPLGIFVLKIHY